MAGSSSRGRDFPNGLLRRAAARRAHHAARNETVVAMTERPFTTFIQWKGTDLCMDFHCPECGDHQHIDGMFVDTIRCDGCGAAWTMPTDIGPLLVRAHGEKGDRE